MTLFKSEREALCEIFESDAPFETEACRELAKESAETIAGGLLAARLLRSRPEERQRILGTASGSEGKA